VACPFRVPPWPDYLRPVRRSTIFPVLAVLTCILGSCRKDGTTASDVSTAASITFRSDSGFTYMNDTVGISDTLRVGMTAESGSDALTGFLLTVSYDNTSALHTDSATVSSSPFHFEKQLITRAQTGTEKWTFTVIEGDGDRTNRSLTLTVQ
jgi:hypothetical protein